MVPIYLSVSSGKEFQKIKSKDQKLPKPIAIIETQVDTDLYIGTLYSVGIMECSNYDESIVMIKTNSTYCSFGEERSEVEKYQLIYITAFCLTQMMRAWIIQQQAGQGIDVVYITVHCEGRA